MWGSLSIFVCGQVGGVQCLSPARWLLGTALRQFASAVRDSHNTCRRHYIPHWHTRGAGRGQVSVADTAGPAATIHLGVQAHMGGLRTVALHSDAGSL